MSETNTSALPTSQIQAFMAAGFSDLRCGEFLLLTVTQGGAGAARQWLGRLLESTLVASADQIGQAAEQRRVEVATVAISHAGLIALGVEPSQQFPFPSIFSDGMGQAERAMQLGDSDATSWRWSDCAGPADRQVTHLLVAHYWSEKADVRVAGNPFCREVLAQAGLKMLCVPADRRYLQLDGTAIEPFRFLDGVAQPVIAGLRTSGERQYRDADAASRVALNKNRVAAGEFVLGQRNEYGDIAYAPDVSRWPGPQRFADGGSYIAVRQIVQDVAALRAFERTHPTPAGDPSIVEKMVGRRRDGTPLCPHDAEDFGYRVADAEGFGCPRGAHMRRANPRDSFGHDVTSGEAASKLHRLLRRGRAYLMGRERGMFFMALNADLDRQFAFVQQRWIANPRFGGLAGETDPFVGQTHRAFTIQHPVLGQRITGVPRFTQVVGGGYFLLLSLPALGFLAGDRQPLPPAA